MPKEVADFLEQDRKRAAAQDKQDERHLSKSEFETVLSCVTSCVSVEETVLGASSLKICGTLSRPCRRRTKSSSPSRYDSELTMEEMGNSSVFPKWRCQSELRKLHQTLEKLCRMTGLFALSGFFMGLLGVCDGVLLA